MSDSEIQLYRTAPEVSHVQEWNAFYGQNEEMNDMTYSKITPVNSNKFSSYEDLDRFAGG